MLGSLQVGTDTGIVDAVKAVFLPIENR